MGIFFFFSDDFLIAGIFVRRIFSGMENTSKRPLHEFGYQWSDPQYYNLLRQYAALHRRQPTFAESLLWEYLGAGKIDGNKFRRQHIISRYIADFVCLKKRLIIEVDGRIHQLPENLDNDTIRQGNLEALGFIVLRFTNKEVTGALDTVLATISQVLASLPEI